MLPCPARMHLSIFTFHIIFSTKGRQPFIIPELRERLYPFIGGIIRDERATPCIINGMPDHVHILVRTPTDLAPASLVRHIKSRSTQWIRATFPEHAAFSWQEGYAIFAVSASVRSRVSSYIARQQEHHAGKGFDEELRQFLDAHGIPLSSQSAEPAKGTKCSPPVTQSVH